MKLLYLEDDNELASTIQEYLENEGFEVIVAYDGEDALIKSYDESFDLFIFDIQVPKMNGFELLKNLREANIETPTIFTTSLNSIEDLSKGYSVGADDYLKKPFSLKELLLRIQALLKREYKSIDNIIEVEQNVFFDTNLQQIKVDNKIFDLNNKENQLLKLLFKNKNQCVNFDKIFETVWPFSSIHSEQSLRTYIKNLRKIVGKEKIVSIKKQGYMFV